MHEFEEFSEEQPTPRPDIDYPCTWRYRIIGTSEQGVREAARHAAQDDTVDLQRGNQSRSGAYESFEMELTVQSEAHRNRVFRALQNHEAVKFVL